MKINMIWLKNLIRWFTTDDSNTSDLSSRPRYDQTKELDEQLKEQLKFVKTGKHCSMDKVPFSCSIWKNEEHGCMKCTFYT